MSLPAGVLAPGTRLGKYEIVERLGSGGEAIVYKGYDALLDRYVAIKQVAPQLAADQKFAERFREVAKQLAKLACEQIVTIYELVEQNGQVFVMMEYVEGHSIETTLSNQPGPVEVKAVLQIIWRIAAGLAAMHKAGIVHRDVKPGNIIVCEGLRVKITDFGVAARIGAPASMRLGTTKYMAPELFSGEPADARADIYSLGMIAYEMLVGRAKFNEIFHDLVRDPHSEALRWMKWHTARDQTAPALSEVNPNVPAALSAIVGKMLAKDPAERFASVEALGREIRASFSPRARPPQALKRRKVSLAAASAAEGRGGSAALAGEEGDELSVAPAAPASEPLTAAIPKKPLSLAAKLVILGAGVAVALSALAAYLVVQGFRQEGLRKQAEVVYGEGLNRYRKAGKDDRSADKQQDYEAALKAFREVIEKYDKTAYARQSEVMGYLCRSYLDILAGDWNAMDRDAGMAEQRIIDFQRRSDLRQFAQQTKQDLTEMREYRQDSQRFAEAIAQAREAETNAEFDRADALLVEQAGQYAKQSDRIALIQAMRQAIAEKKKQGEYQTWVKRGDEARKNKKTDEARAGYLKALDILEQSKGSLARNVYDDLKKAAQAKLDVLDKEVRYAAAMAEVAKAIKAGSKLAAADAMKQALLIRPDDPDRLKDQIPTLEHDYWIDQGRKELDANNLPAAETAYKNARAAKPSPEAQAGLDRI
jgi:tRNA A-37 threonylcarbamoyl transferase component Bud32